MEDSEVLGLRRMNDFKNMKDEKLLKWIDLYEMMPVVRLLLTEEEYRQAILEAYKRFKGNEMFKYCYFIYINSKGDLDDYTNWFKKLNGE